MTTDTVVCFKSRCGLNVVRGWLLDRLVDRLAIVFIALIKLSGLRYSVEGVLLHNVACVNKPPTPVLFRRV